MNAHILYGAAILLLLGGSVSFAEPVILSPSTTTTNAIGTTSTFQTEKMGLDTTVTNSRTGFGFSFDERVDSLTRLLQLNFPDATATDQATADMLALMVSFSGSDFQILTNFQRLYIPLAQASKDVPAAVGKQVTLDRPKQTSALTDLLDVAIKVGSRVDLVAKANLHGVTRGWFADSTTGRFQSDRAAQANSPQELIALAGTGSEITFTIVPRGTGRRIGIDRDSDGFLDQDELEAGSKLDDATSIPVRVLIRLSWDAEAVTLFWNTAPGRTYRVEVSNELGQGIWRPLEGEHIANGST